MGRLVETNRYGILKGVEAKLCTITVKLSATGVELDSMVVASDRARLLDELDRKLSDCQVSESSVSLVRHQS